MTVRTIHRTFVLTVALGGLLALGPRGYGQPPDDNPFGAAPTADSPVAQPPVSEPAQSATTESPSRTTELAGGEDALQETTIYVPFDELRDVFEKEGRGVFLPYEEFKRLWDAARAAEKRSPAERPPIDAVITAIHSRAEVLQDVVAVEARLSIEMLADGWLRVPLRLEGAAIQEATIDGQPARIVPAAGGFELLVHRAADQPAGIELQLRYARAFEKTPGLNQVHFAAPRAPLNRWQILVPEPGVDVRIEPLLAATMTVVGGDASIDDDDPPDVDEVEQERPPSPLPRNADENDNADEPQETDAEQTELLAFVGAAETVTIQWTPKAEGATGMAALTSVQAQQQVFVNEGMLRTRAVLDYSISRAQLRQLTVEVPTDQKIVNVFDANVRKWEVTEQEGGVQRIVVELFEPANERQQLTLELEQFREVSTADQLAIPMIRAVDVGRQQGVVAIRIDPALRAEVVSSEGSSQIDLADLPAELASETWSFAYRYATTPYELAVSVEKIEPQMQAWVLAECSLQATELRMEIQSFTNIERAGVFQLEFDVPENFSVIDVRGEAHSGATAAAVDTFYLAQDNPQRLVVNLSRKALGATSLRITLARQLDDANLLSPTGASSTLEFTPPSPVLRPTDRFEGKLVLYAPESLRVTPETEAGWRSIPHAEAFTPIASANAQASDSRMVLAYAYERTTSTLGVSVERRSPYITARQMLTVEVESGVLKFRDQITYDIRYSSVDSLRIDLPETLAADVRNLSGSLRDSLLNPQPDDVPEGYVAWELAGETELLGTHQVQLYWERPINELEVGGSLDFVVPRLVPQNVDRSWGQILVTKQESIDVETTADVSGLRPIDPTHDVLPEERRPDAALALEFYDAWGLTLRATRYQPQEVKLTSIERALISVVITRSDQQSVQAVYRVRSARQRLAISLPDAAEFATQPVRLNGQPVSLQRGNQDLYYIPLASQTPEQDFLLELRYSVPNAGEEIAIPALPEDPALQKVYLAVYLPEEQVVLHTAGPWTEEFEWEREGVLSRRPENNRTQAAVSNWVVEGISAGASPTFQTLGSFYLFSAIHPAQPPESNLRLSVLHENVLAGGVFLAVLLLGGVFLLRSWRTKLAALVLLFIALVACGVFAPTLAQQLLNMPLFASLAIVLVGWSAVTVVRTVQRIEKHRPPAPVLESSATSKPATESDTSTAPPNTAPPPDATGDEQPPRAEGGERHD